MDRLEAIPGMARHQLPPEAAQARAAALERVAAAPTDKAAVQDAIDVCETVRDWSTAQTLKAHLGRLSSPFAWRMS